jgi:hypothetical protein
MFDISNIKLSEEDIREIELAYQLYRNIDLESFAKKYEDELINNKTTLFSTIFISPGLSSFHDIKRVSINKTIRTDKTNNRLLKIEDLKYPPSNVAEKLYYNRASYKKQSIFYGGFGEFQALFENPPNTGDLFTISTWHQKANTKLCYASIFHDQELQYKTNIFQNDWNHYINQLEKLDQRTSEALDKLFSLITFFFIRPVNPFKKIEYIFSANIANKIFEMPYLPKIEAILYPSVPLEYISSNLAILPKAFDEKFDFVMAEECIVLNKTTGKNQWMSFKIAKTETIIDGVLVWENSYIDHQLLNFMRNHNVDIKMYT